VVVASSPVGVGDVCRLTVEKWTDQPAEGRLLLVLDVDTDAGLASVMLAHTDFEIRTSLDVILTGDELGIPFDLALQTDIVGPVGVASLTGTKVGHVGDELLDALRDAVDTGQIPDSLVGRTGVPLRGEDDARWQWKIQEGVLLDRILAAFAPVTSEALTPVQVLAKALSTVGCGGAERDPLVSVTQCLVDLTARRETLPTPVLTLLAQPRVRAALGNDVMRAIGPSLRVA
jgi:hypothetical protein